MAKPKTKGQRKTTSPSPRVQTRRTISLPREIFEKLRKEAEEKRIPMTQLAEQALRYFWDEGTPVERDKRPGIPGRYIVNLDMTMDAKDPDDAERKAGVLAKKLQKHNVIHYHLVLGADPE